MQVFKVFFKLIKSYRGTLILYMVIFLAVAIIMSINNSVDVSETEDAFTASSLRLGIVDEDHGTVSKAILSYFEDEHKITEMEMDEDAILNELYWRRLDYVLVIPSGYEKALASEHPLSLQSMKVPGSFVTGYFESELSQYTGRLKGLLGSGYTMEEALHTLEELKSHTVEVQFGNYVNENQTDAATLFFQYVPYLAISLGILGVGLILLHFYRKDLKDRMECSSTPLVHRSMGMTAGILVYGLILLLFLFVTAVLISKGKLLSDTRLPWFLLNSTCMIALGLSMGFLTGTVAKNNEAVTGIVNIAGIGLCFLGGVFVPLQFFSDSIKNVAKFLPSYWYVVSNQTIGSMKEMSPELTAELLPQMGIVLGYALVFFAVTLVLQAAGRKR